MQRWTLCLKVENNTHIRCIWFERGGTDRICPLGNSTRSKATVSIGETRDRKAFVVFWRDGEDMAFEAMLQVRASNISACYLTS